MNTTNTYVRSEQRSLTQQEKEAITALRAAAAAFLETCLAQPHSREKSLAITNAQQALFWAVHAVTK